MGKDHMSRKLAVLLHADVVGSTSLVQKNETLAHERIQDTFRRFSETISSYGGVALEIRGDALVAEFAMVSDAVSASLGYQTANTTFNKQLSDDIRPVLRIGIAMGEVVVADNTVTGEGIILAQRLEQLVKPGGVSIQGAAYETLPKRLPFEFENLGEQQVKGFDEPVRVYTVSLKSGGTVPEPQTVVQLEKSVPDLPEKPSIAILPFTNMSADPEQEYFSDGITEDIITELSRFHSLFVIARNSSFHYKGQSPSVSTVGRELGVQYLVEGSVRKAANRVRITAQLVDTSKGAELWADRYDRELNDIFTLQDEVVQAIASAIPNRIEAAATQVAHKKPTTSLTAYDYLLRGEWEWWRDNDHQALTYFQKVVEIDPQCARAFARLAVLFGYRVFSQGVAAEAGAQTARKSAERALDIDDADASVLAMASTVYSQIGDYDRAQATLERALALNPHDAEIIYRCGITTAYQGDPMEALQWFSKAMRLNPYYPDSWLEGLMEGYYISRQYHKALEMVKKYRDPPFHLFIQMAAIYAQLNLTDDVRKSLEMFEQARPDDFDSKVFITASLNVFRLQEHRDLWLEGYQKAGVGLQIISGLTR
jgi:adenylate cyclase